MCEEKETPVTEEEVAGEVQEPVDEAAAKIAELEAALASQQEQYTRMLAEYANYKRRTEQEKEQIGTFAKADVLARLLPVIDDLDRAADAPDGPDYRKGVDMIVNKFHSELEKLGLSEISALGEPFDPEVHHAVMREDADGVEPDTVTEVFQKGYRFGDRVVRPAMVRVAN
ncbi:MAG: nucleotide exchange factor GrpE [Ruminococcaceae bacterium]|nr:nucleotide exchange factor GrpE [Oscillospiraceae bacterium]